MYLFCISCKYIVATIKVPTVVLSFSYALVCKLFFAVFCWRYYPAACVNVYGCIRVCLFSQPLK